MTDESNCLPRRKHMSGELPIKDRWQGANSIKVHRIDWHALGSHDAEIYFEPGCEKCRARNPDEPTFLETASGKLAQVDVDKPHR